MNAALGERTLERGFVPAPMILGDRLVDSVGGGISQGRHDALQRRVLRRARAGGATPHSFYIFYIDRYPRGREATISWGGPELVFRNDWPAAALVRVPATPTAVTVRLHSERLGRRVETTTSAPTDHVSPALPRQGRDRRRRPEPAADGPLTGR